MKLARQILEARVEIDLGGTKYQLNVQKGIDFLIKYTIDNPDMGNFDDFKDDKARLKGITKQTKSLSVSDVKDQITLLFDDDEVNIKDLEKAKVINK